MKNLIIVILAALILGVLGYLLINSNAPKENQNINENIVSEDIEKQEVDEGLEEKENNSNSFEINIVPETKAPETVPQIDSETDEAPSGKSLYRDEVYGFSLILDNYSEVPETADPLEGHVGLWGFNEDFPEDIITIDIIKSDIYEDNDAKFGPFSLSYDYDQKCWTSYDPDQKGFCREPQVNKNGLEYFTSTARWATFVFPLEKNVFLRLNITGSGDTRPLREVVETVDLI